MVILLILITVVACLAVARLLRATREALVSKDSPEPAPVLSYLVARELPGGLFLHGGHTWAKLDPSGAVQVGIDGFARGILGRVDRFELPPGGATLRQG